MCCDLWRKHTVLLFSYFSRYSSHFHSYLFDSIYHLCPISLYSQLWIPFSFQPQHPHSDSWRIPKSFHFQPQCPCVQLEADIWRTWRYLQDSWSSSLFSVENSLWDIHDHCRDPSELANPLFHNILDESSNVSISGLVFTSFHGWNTQRSRWVNAEIQRHANSLKCFNKQMVQQLGNKGSDICKSTCRGLTQTLSRFRLKMLPGFGILLIAHGATITIIILTLP